MRVKIKSFFEKTDFTLTAVHTKTTGFVYKHASAMLFVCGVCLLITGFQQFASAQPTTGEPLVFDDFYIRRAVCALYALIEGAFGALLATIAGIGAIVSSAFGAYRAAVSLIVVSCGSFILRSLVSLFFGDVAPGCGVGSANPYIRFPN